MVESKKKMLAYEESRLKRLEENKKRMEDLNLSKLAQAVRNATSPKPSPMKKVKPRVRQAVDLSDMRKSNHVADKPPPNFKVDCWNCNVYFDYLRRLEIHVESRYNPSKRGDGDWRTFGIKAYFGEVDLSHFNCKSEVIPDSNSICEAEAKLQPPIAADNTILQEKSGVSGSEAVDGNDGNETVVTEGRLKDLIRRSNVLVEKMGLPNGFKSVSPTSDEDGLWCSYTWNKAEQRIATLAFDRDRKSKGVISTSASRKKSLLEKKLLCATARWFYCRIGSYF